MPIIRHVLLLARPRPHLILIPDLQLLRHSLVTLLLIINRNPLRATHLPPLLQDLRIRLLTHLAPPRTTLLRQLPPHLLPRLEATHLPLHLGIHKRPDGQQRGADPPRGLPRLLVVAADAEADLAVDLEAARGGEEAEGRRAQRVLRREDDAAVVDAARVGGGGGRPREGEVPVEEVRVGDGVRAEVRGGRGGGGGGELGGLPHEAPEGGGHGAARGSQMVGMSVISF